MIIRKSVHRFETVNYDKQLFKDYAVNQTKKDKNGIKTELKRNRLTDKNKTNDI